MKKSVLNLFLASFVIFLICSSSKSKKGDFEKNYKEVSHRCYAGIHEVTNVEFREFINDLKAQNKIEAYDKYYPDTTQWMKKFTNSFNEPYVEKYFWHPEMNNYPVVNVSKEAAEKYCEWLTFKYNSQEKRKYKKVVFRLPSENEWNQFASVLPGHNLPWYGNFAYDPATNGFNANVKFENKVAGNDKYDYGADGSLTTCKVGSYKQNKIGLYDIIGNVAELTNSGVIKGGSWDNTIDECVVNKTQQFQIPDPRVGFRVVMIIEKL
ncbi:hypothetical protein DMA11_17210 [Marinilabiliaceae bacterium JC017]|nr:hypothetical protein DMA11_17210 [Marinilabiliaceae bacterium JC017]